MGKDIQFLFMQFQYSTTPGSKATLIHMRYEVFLILFCMRKHAHIPYANVFQTH